jgi:hypothetical protein
MAEELIMEYDPQHILNRFLATFPAKPQTFPILQSNHWRNTMKRTTVITSLISAIALLAAFSLQAQDDADGAAPAPLSDVWMVVPKAGHQEEFFAALAADKALRDDKDDSRTWEVYTVAVGDDTDAVQFRACCFDWADQDAYDIEEEEKGFNAHWGDNVAPHIDHYHRSFQTMDWEHSYWPDGEGDGPYYGVTTWNIKFNAGPASGIARRAMSDLAIEKGWGETAGGWLWHYTETGKPRMMIVSSYANFAEMKPPEENFYDFMVEALGEEEAGQIFSDFNSGYSSTDYTIWQREPELSAAPD